MTAANTQDPREHVRSNVFLSAVLAHGSESTAVRVRNISTMGALLDGRNLPPEGTLIQLRRGNVAAAGKVAWHGQNNCGIRFAYAIDVAPWVRRIEHAGQTRVDNILAAVRADEGPNADFEQASDDSLGAISSELSRASDDLSNLPDLTIELAEKLLRIDAVAQRLRNWIADQ